MKTGARAFSITAIVLTGLALASCGGGDQAEAPAAPDASAEAVAPPEQAAAPAAAADNFDLASVPVSTAALGAFPYLRLPAGYRERPNAKTLDFAALPVWTGTEALDREGRLRIGGISADTDTAPDKQFSRLELQRNLQQALRQAGAVRVFEGRLTSEQRDALAARYAGTEEVTQLYAITSSDVSEVWVIRQAERTVWVVLQFEGNNTASWAVLEDKPLEVTAGLTGQ